MPWFNLLLILLLAGIVGLINWQIGQLQKKIWSVEQEQRRIWQFIQRKLPGTVEKSDG